MITWKNAWLMLCETVKLPYPQCDYNYIRMIHRKPNLKFSKIMG